MTSHQHSQVCLPASTSNLGPGFDLFGLALDLTLEVRCLRPAASQQHVLVELGGTASEWPNTPDNTLFRAFDRVAQELGVEPIPHEFGVHSAIPVARGLGSSCAACAAGLLLGAATYASRDQQLARTDLVRLGIELEGHPENSTASLLGGAVLCLPESDGSVHVVHQPVAPNLRFVAAWPSTRIATREARNVLPEQVPFADAVENPRRLALLLEGFRTGDANLLRAGMHDRLHVPYRLALIAGGKEALLAALEAGAHGATISGSGSTLFAVCAEQAVAAVCAALTKALLPHHDKVTAREVHVAFDAPEVIQAPRGGQG